jgi:hypothetical protein
MPVQPLPTSEKKLSDPDKLTAFHPQDEFSSAPTFDLKIQLDTFDQMQSYVKSYAKKMYFKISVNSSAYKDGIAMRGHFYCSPKSCLKEKCKRRKKIAGAALISISTRLQQQESTTSQNQSSTTVMLSLLLTFSLTEKSSSS